MSMSFWRMRKIRIAKPQIEPKKVEEPEKAEEKPQTKRGKKNADSGTNSES